MYFYKNKNYKKKKKDIIFFDNKYASSKLFYRAISGKYGKCFNYYKKF
jgi:hypothetical protein